MVRFRLPATLLACLVGVSTITSPQTVAMAQAVAEGAPLDDALKVPPAVLASIVSGAGGAAVINRFLRGDRPPAALVTRRAAALIRQIGAQRTKLKPADLLSAVDRVVHVAARSLSYASVMRMAVTADYRPENAVLAWDFGSPLRKVLPGFERIQADDKRIAGDGIEAHRQNQQNSILSDGLSGVKKIELRLKDGTYRIILMTQDIGNPALASLPFGAEIRINGVPLLVNGRGSADWLDHALLTGSGARQAGGDFDRLGGHLTGNLAGESATLYSTQRGGAIVLEGTALDGKLVIELRNFGKANSYLTGLIVEPPDRVSDLVLSRSAFDSIVSTDVRLALETELLVVAAETVQGIAPADGQAFESDDVVTEN